MRSTIAIFVIIFAVLGLLLGFSESYDAMKVIQPSSGGLRVTASSAPSDGSMPMLGEAEPPCPADPAKEARWGLYWPGCDLHGANLQGANLVYATLSQSNLQAADLSSANLQNAYLIAVNLEDANLQDADLENADLTGAYVDGNLHCENNPVCMD